MVIKVNLTVLFIRSVYVNFFQVFIFDIFKVGQVGSIEVVAESQEVLLQLYFGQQFQQLVRVFFRLYVVVFQFLWGGKNGLGIKGCREVIGDVVSSVLDLFIFYYIVAGKDLNYRFVFLKWLYRMFGFICFVFCQ